MCDPKSKRMYIDMSSDLSLDEQRCMLFVHYMLELRRLYSDDDMSDVEDSVNAACSVWSEYRNDSDGTEWHDIIDDNGDIIGFVIVSERGSVNCHCNADRSICEAYVVPAYRNKGFMSRAMDKLLDEHPGTWCGLVLRRNEHALDFWRKLFDRNGYFPVCLGEEILNDEIRDKVYLLGFSPGVTVVCCGERTIWRNADSAAVAVAEKCSALPEGSKERDVVFKVLVDILTKGSRFYSDGSEAGK